MEFFQIKRRVHGKANSFWGFIAILQSGLIFENIRRMFFVEIHVRCPSDPDWQQKHSSNVLENETRSQNSAYTARKSLIIGVLCGLFEQISFGMNRDILKNPTWSGVKNSNKLRVHSHLVTWIPHTAIASLNNKGSGPKDTVFTQNIWTPQLLTILVLKFERAIYYLMLCLKRQTV